jgi:hypothetical protein
MPEDIGGTFDGGGSVHWEVITEEDDDSQAASDPHGKAGRKSRGVDRRNKTHFRVIMRVPSNPAQREAFLRQFNIAPSPGGTVEVTLPIEQRPPNHEAPKQVTVTWNGNGPQPPATSV